MKRAWKVTRSKVIAVGRVEMMERMKRYSNGEKDIKAENILLLPMYMEKQWLKRSTGPL
jgi:hypothetical protein